LGLNPYPLTDEIKKYIIEGRVKWSASLVAKRKTFDRVTGG